MDSPRPSRGNGNLIPPSKLNGEGNIYLALICRSGDRKEALAGPLIYAVGLFIATIAFFR